MYRTIFEAQHSFFQTLKLQQISYRIQKLKKLKQVILAYETEITEALHNDFKKHEFETLTSEIGVVINELNLYIKKLNKWSKPQTVKSSLLNFPSSAKIYRQAYGNVLIIAPWNYPFNLSIIPLINAVGAGNTVVLKPSEYSVHTSRVIEKILQEVFPPEHVSVVQGDAKTSQELLRLPWNYIFFTGSTQVGKYVYEAAARHLIPVTLELGGKSPVVIDATADLLLAAKRIVWGKFLNAGQTCIAPDYVLIDQKSVNEFINLLHKEIIAVYGDNPQLSEYYPRIINRNNWRRLVKTLEGQNIVSGGRHDENDLYLEPTIVLNPSLQSDLMQYEIFGPILPVISYQNTEEMELVLQQHPNPLAFYIFSNDKSVQNYFIDKYGFGGGVINDTIVHIINHNLPFGGVGKSGLGQYHGRYGFETFSRPKPVVKRGTWFDVPIRYLPPDKWKKRFIRLLMLR